MSHLKKITIISNPNKNVLYNIHMFLKMGFCNVSAMNFQIPYSQNFVIYIVWASDLSSCPFYYIDLRIHFYNSEDSVKLWRIKLNGSFEGVEVYSFVYKERGNEQICKLGTVTGQSKLPERLQTVAINVDHSVLKDTHANTEPKINVEVTLEKLPNILLLQKLLYNVIKTFLKVSPSQTNI